MNTASDYAWNRKYDGAQRLYRAVNDKEANSDWGVKARLGLARIEVLDLIGQKEYEDANQRIDSMIADFNDEPALQTDGGQDLAVALFHIGQEFFWQRQFGEARDAFDRGVEKFSDNPTANEMRLWSAKTGCCVLIYGRRATEQEIIGAIDKMITDFKDDPGLAGAVYWISKEYEWTKGTSLSRAGWFNAPNSVYQQIMQKFSDTPFGQAAQLDQKRLNHRMIIFSLIKEPNQEAVDAAIEEMVVDLSGRPEVAGELYWIACGCEERPDKEQRSKEIYQRIVQDYPDTAEASRAALDVRRRFITDLINAGDINGSEVLMDEFIADFNQHPYAGSCLGRVAIGYFKKGAGLKDKRQYETANEYFERAGGVYQKIIMGNLEKGTDAAYLYYYAAATYQELRQWENAIENYQKVVDDYPGFEYVCGAQAGVGWCYEWMVKEGKIPKEQVNPLIEQAYTIVLTKYPDCYIAHYAAFQLADMSVEKGDKVAAIQYYRLFLELATPQNSRIAEAKTKLAALEGNNQ